MHIFLCFLLKIHDRVMSLCFPQDYLPKMSTPWENSRICVPSNLSWWGVGGIVHFTQDSNKNWIHWNLMTATDSSDHIFVEGRTFRMRSSTHRHQTLYIFFIIKKILCLPNNCFIMRKTADIVSLPASDSLLNTFISPENSPKSS